MSAPFNIDPNAVPVIHPPRRVPIALRDRLQDELQSMEKQKIIVKVTEPTEWVNWLPVAARIKFKSLMLAYRVLEGSAPTYINCNTRFYCS